jgi:hypothetical protein
MRAGSSVAPMVRCETCGKDFQKHACYIKRNPRHFCSASCFNVRPMSTAKFWAKVDKCGPAPEYNPSLGPCWLWTGTKNNAGYGMTCDQKQDIGAHRMAFKLTNGYLPELPLDHLCRVRHCCNPSHLEPVTHRVNILRGVGAGARNAKKSHCVNGHEFTPENTAMRSDGTGRHCKTCRVETNRRNWLRRKNVTFQ